MVKNSPDWVHVYTAQGDGEASVIISLLESEGIEVKRIRESVGRLYAITVDGLGQVKIFVPRDKFDIAKELIGEEVL